MPKVTVVIAVHNGEKHIATCVQSILAQTFRDFEVVVVNDGSSDRTLEALTALPSERTTLINSEVNRGVAAARNIGDPEVHKSCHNRVSKIWLQDTE